MVYQQGCNQAEINYDGEIFTFDWYMDIIYCYNDKIQSTTSTTSTTTILAISTTAIPMSDGGDDINSNANYNSILLFSIVMLITHFCFI